MNEAIKDLPLLPSKKQPNWKRHQRPNQEEVLEHEGSFYDGKVLDSLIEQCNQQYKGKSVAEKCAILKKMMAEHADGKNSLALPGSGRGEPDYLEPFREFIETIPESFDEFVPESVKQSGDALLLAGEKVGYPISGYTVAKGDGYSKMLREGASRIIYHQYRDHKEHGEELLRRLTKLRIAIPYDTTFIAGAVVWDKSWENQQEVRTEKVGNREIGRNMQFVIAFKPENPKEAEKLVEFFKRNAKPGGKETVAHSWQTPDIRSSFVEKVGQFQPSMLNVKRMGEYELLVLKSEPLNGFNASKIWLNKELSAFAKSLRILITAHRGIPLVVRASKSVAGVKEPNRAMGGRFVVMLKAVPPGSRRPGSKYSDRQGLPGHYDYTYEDEKAEQEKKKQEDIQRAIEEDRRRSKTPLPDEEKLEERQQVRKELLGAIRAGDWHAFVDLLKRRNIQEGTKQYEELRVTLTLKRVLRTPRLCKLRLIACGTFRYNSYILIEEAVCLPSP